MSCQVNFEVFAPGSKQTGQSLRSASDDLRILAGKVRKALDSWKSWHILPLDSFELTCKYLRLSDINALGTAHRYFAHLIFGRKRPLPEALGDPYHPFIVPAAYKTHLEACNTKKTPLTFREYQSLEGVYRRFGQTMEPSHKIGYLDMSNAEIEDDTLRKILDTFPRPVMLSLRNNPKLKDLTPLADCTFLQYLDLSGCKELTQLDPLKNCKSLRFLLLEDCTQIADLTPLAGCTNLQKLQIPGTGVLSLEPLSRLFSLNSLNCKGCLQIPLNELGHLRQLRLLESLHLDIAVTDWGLSVLSDLVSLRHLFLYDCTEVTNGGLLHLARLPRLRGLLLGRAPQITDEGLTHLGRIQSLHDLTIPKCGKITDLGVQALTALPVLKNLTVGPSYQISQAGLNFLIAQEFLAWRLVTH